jgi:hypothetical protein
MPVATWLLICHHPHDTYVELVTTDHPDGPVGHVPEDEDHDAWLCEEVFGFEWEPGVDLEVRNLGTDWAPHTWTRSPSSSEPVPVRNRRRP